jgi:hypothetical protein
MFVDIVISDFVPLTFRSVETSVFFLVFAEGRVCPGVMNVEIK